MQALGLVAEYNPFHNGHFYHLQQARQLTGADVVVAVMSGNFTQRGEPTILDKWQRTQAALANGVDLVVELPVFNAVQPAHRFAEGALRLLNDLQVVTVVFGAEHPAWNFDSLVAAEARFKASDFKDYHATYATQFNQQLSAQTGYSLTDPNDILAFAYYKARQEGHYTMNLLPIQRRGNDYHDQTITGRLASASAIRAAWSDLKTIKNTVPATTVSDLAQLQRLPSWDLLYPILRNQLIQTPVEWLQQIYQMGEGIEYRMKEAAQRALTYADFIRLVKTKRYTYAYLSRLSLYVILNISKVEHDRHQQVPYHHILGFNQVGQAYLNQVKKQLDFPLIVKVNRDERDGRFKLDYRAGKLYQNFTKVEQDMKHAPIRTVKEITLTSE